MLLITYAYENVCRIKTKMVTKKHKKKKKKLLKNQGIVNNSRKSLSSGLAQTLKFKN